MHARPIRIVGWTLAVTIGGATGSHLSGCYDPDLTTDGFFRCSDGRCPDGFSCNSDQVCVRSGAGADAGNSDAVVDAEDARDGGADAGVGFGCSIEEETEIRPDGPILTESVLGRFGVAFDREASVLRVAFVTTAARANVQNVELASLAVGQAATDATEWSAAKVDEMVGDDAAVPYAAIDTFDGDYAVVYGSTQTQPRVVTRERQSVPLLSTDLTQPSASAAVRFTNASRLLSALPLAAAEVPGAAAEIYTVAVRDEMAGLITEPPDVVRLSGDDSGVPMAASLGLVVHTKPDVADSAVVTLALTTISGAGSADQRTLRVYRGSWPLAQTPNQIGSTALPIADPTQVSELARLGGLGLDLRGDGEPEVLVTGPTSSDGVDLFVWGGAGDLELLNGDRRFQGLGLPSLAIAPPYAGFTAIDGEGRLFVGARLNDEIVLGPLLLADMANLPVHQAQIAAREVDEGHVSFDVVYSRSTGVFGVSDRRGLYHRLIVCSR